MHRLARFAVACLATVIAMAAAGAQEVTLPLSQYEELRSRSVLPPDKPQPPATRFALESADFDIAVGAASARLVQRLVLTLSVDSWERVPLGQAGSITAARFGGLEGRVEVDEKSEWALQVRGRGRHEITLESVAPVTRDETATRPTASFALRFPPAAVVRGRLAAPAGTEEVRLEGNGLLRPGTPGSWSFLGGSAQEAGVTFALLGRRTLPPKAGLPLRYDAISATAAVVSRTQMRVRGWIEARVAQGQLTELRIPIPTGLEVVSVTGRLAGWDVADGALVLATSEPIEGALAVEFELTGEPRMAFASPVLEPIGSRRTVRLVKAALQGDGLLTLVEPGAVRAPDASEVARLPPALHAVGGRILAISDAARPPHWEVEWAEGAEVLAAQVDRLLLDVAIGESGRAAYRLWAEVRNRGAQQLSFALPPGFSLISARRDGEEVAAGATSTGLSIPLRAGEAAQSIYLDGVLPITLPPPGKGQLALPLPALSAPAARIEVRMVLPAGRTWRLADASRSGSVRGPVNVNTVAATNVNALLSQVKSAAPASAVHEAPPGMFLTPPGYVELTAAWSALSASPEPLELRFESRKEVSPWM